MIVIRPMTIEDYEAVLEFWLRHPELGVSPEFDSPARIGAYLKRNNGMSTVAVLEGRIVGTAICGHDGRRGSLYHVGVDAEFRGQGIARLIIDRCTAGLAGEGIHSAFLFTHESNPEAARFWSHNGWAPAPFITYHSKWF